MKIEGDFQALTLYLAEDLLSGILSLSDLIHPDDSDIYDKIISTPVLDEPEVVVCRMVDKKGLISLIEISHISTVTENDISIDLTIQSLNPQAADLDNLNNSGLVHFSAMLEKTHDFIYFKDLHHFYTDGSRPLPSQTPYKNISGTDLKGKTDYDIFTKKFADTSYALEQKIFSGEQLEVRETHVISDNNGEKVWIDEQKYPIHDEDGYVIGLFGISRDVTVLNQTQEELKENENRLSLATRHNGIGIWDLNPRTQALVWDESMYAVFRIKSEDFSGAYDAWQASLHPDDREQAEAELKTALEGGEPFNTDFRICCSNGEIRHIKAAANVFFDNSGKAIRMLGINYDITEQKQAGIQDLLQNEALQLIARNAELSDTLSAIIKCIEQQHPQLRCSILLLDPEKEHLLIGAAPSLPDFYNKEVDRLELGENVATCGVTALTGKRTATHDIQNHPNWTAYKEIVIQAELESCVSEPIHSSQGELIGTFAIYYPLNYSIPDELFQLIEKTAHIASIAIEKHQANIKLKTSTERWEFAIEGSGDGVWDYNIVTGETLFSRRWKEMLGYQGSEIGSNADEWLKRIHAEDKLRVEDALQSYLTGLSPSYNITFRMLCKNGSYKWILARGIVVARDNNTPLRMVGTHTDITQSKQSDEKLRLAASVFTFAREGIMITDEKAIIIQVNDAFTDITGYSSEEIIGRSPSVLKSGRQSQEFYVDMWDSLSQYDYWTGEVWNRSKTGKIYVEMLSISTVRDSIGNIVNYVALFSDITLVKEQQKQLERNAHYDPLTNLSNRTLLADRLSQAMLHCSRHEKSLAVVFLDLDHFKEVNDTHGHDVGDELLVLLSQRMKEALREEDTLARIGGDEFIAVLADLDQTSDCKPILDRLLLAASSIITIEGKMLQVSASIGVTIYPRDNVEADQLMRHADQAMYIAKQEGKNHYHFFDTAQDDEMHALRESIAEISRALELDEFELYYQPKVNMQTGVVIGVEALIRWQHPTRGTVSPAEFLPMIENQSLSIEIGEWVIKSALTQLSQWFSSGLKLPISVNISAFQLQQKNFVERLDKILKEYPDVAPKNLELEILETSALNNISEIATLIRSCNSLGVNFSIDDFGTGYSSLTYLRHLPVNTVKIDQSFIRDMLIDPDDLAIVEAVIGLSKAFHRSAIAEGVETIEHGIALLQLGCYLAQGYGIARPMPASLIADWVTSWKPDEKWRSASINQ